MRIALFNLSNTAGRILKPIFETLANSVIPSLELGLKKLEGPIGIVIDAITSALDLASSLLKLDFSTFVKDIQDPEKNPLIPKKEQLIPGTEEKFGVVAETATILTEIAIQTRAALERIFKGEIFGGGYDLAIAQAGGGTALIINSVIDLFQFIDKTISRFDKEHTLVNGGTR